MDTWWQEITNMHKYGMWKPDTKNQTFSHEMPPPIDGHEKNTTSKWYKKVTGRRLWSATDKEVS